MSDRRKMILIPLLIIGIIITSAILVMPYLVSGKIDTVPVSYYFEQNIPEHKPHHEEGAFSVLTLNIGHGRGASLHQLIQSRAGITTNTDSIDKVIINEQIDIAAFQEVDGPSFWNGGLDLIERLAENSGMPHGIWTKNVETFAMSYGTALLSNLSYSSAGSYTFKARPFILPKGFTAGLFRISEESDEHICLVSLHLAPLLPQMRRLQAAAVIDFLNDLDCPIVVCGDFNCGWSSGSAVNKMTEELNLKAWKPTEKGLSTHGAGRRLDWILISEELEFIDYRVLNQRLSDHSAVKAVIRYK
ncbi:MAG: endonuclease/exonuclease/phosphatase family protein [Spirochaetales bacterium]|uniref:Endonuclease/exonuclease/phosphatase family protein n=1 Tax=Candidatus Thalassospirochaeta sargassi TaxID=3119039 RepID=A0AAJ1IEQ1_9SPIO|nr:endonuclease/exonuclease/phosphatase family protein [Spirochaetales bacterium]